MASRKYNTGAPSELRGRSEGISGRDGAGTMSFPLLLLAGIVMAVFGLLALTGWFTGLPLLASFGTNLVPMAPVTAVLFILYGLAVCYCTLAPLGVRTFQISVAVGCFAGLVSLLLLMLSCLKIHCGIEHLGLNIAESVGGAQTGHMSPVSAFCFLLASVSFLASLPRLEFRCWRVNLALSSAGVLLGICFIFLLPYLFGSPLLYGGTFIPPAFSTILAFTMLGLALVILDRRTRYFFYGPPAVNSIMLFHFIIIFLFLATGIVIVGYTYYRHLKDDYSDEVGRKLSAVAELKVAELVQWRKERLMDGSVFFKNQTFSTLVRRFFEKPADEDLQRQLLDWLGKYPTYGIYNQIRLLDARGGSRLVLPTGQETPCSVIVKDAAEVQGLRKMFIQDFYRNDEDQRIYLAVMIPILDASNADHPLGVLVMRIDPMSYLYPLIQHWPTSSPSAETLLLRRDGDDILYLNDLRHRANTALTMRVSLDRTEVPAVKVALGQTGIMPGTDYRAVPVLAAAEAVPDSPWFLISKMDTEEIREPLQKQFWQILVLIGVMLFSAGTGMTLLWRQQRVRFLEEKAKSAELLLTSELQYRRLFEAARDGILILDAETGLVVDVNPFLIELLGLQREVFLGRKIWELGLFKDIVANQAKFVELQKQEYIRYEDMALEGGDGKRHEVEFVSNVYLVNQKKVVQCNIRDISERKLAEKNIVEKEERIHLLLDSTAEAIYGLDMNGNCTFCNNSCLRLLGYTFPGELLGKDMHCQIHSKHPDGSPFPAEDCRISQAFKKGERVHVDDEVLWRADGSSFPSECWSFPQCKDGMIIGAVVTFLDITNRKAMEAEKEKLLEQNRQLQKAESLGRMSGAVAHNFNNQLQIVQGYLEMVISDLPPDDSRTVKLASAMQAAHKASEVSRNLLAYLGQRQIIPELLDLSKLCLMSLPAIESEKPDNVILETDLPSPGPCIRADAKQIQQILVNLAINAWESVGAGVGIIRLSVKTVPAADIPESCRSPLGWQSREQCYACLKVADSGHGIKEEDMDKIFDPFFSTKFTGRGLGLSVVLGIVKMHNAVITVESRLGGGSVFSVFFPLSVQMTPPQIEKVSKAPEIVRGGTVLLVEDEATLREMTRLALIGFGFTVLQAKDGVEAIEVFEHHKDEISCLLSDLTMPRMDGWETIAALRAVRHDLPVVLASGYDEMSVMTGEHAELPDFFLTKPYDINKLANTIVQAIAKKAARSELS